MSNVVITDGRSTNTVKVSSDNLLHVQARTETQQEHAVGVGLAFNINPGDFSLTGTSSSTLLYIKNTGDNDIVVPEVVWILAETDGTFGSWLVETVLNPTATSFSTAETPVNLRAGSPNALSATVYKGAYAATVTGGTVAVQSRLNANGRLPIQVPISLPKGASMALRVTAPGSTTAAKVQVAARVFERTTDA